MKSIFKKIAIFSAILIASLAVTNFTAPTQAYAREFGSCDSLLGMTPWDCGITNFDNEDNLVNNIAKIATNILGDFTVIAAYLVLGYVIYGGYLYMFSSGDPGKAASGKKTLTNAFIGLAIVMSANVIFSSIRIALLGASGSFANCISETGCVDANSVVTNSIQWIIGISGLVAAVFIVVGAIGYITSSGDASKLQKAKNTLTYAIIGLAIVALAEIITAFVSNAIRSAEAPATTYQSSILAIDNTKESHEN